MITTCKFISGYPFRLPMIRDRIFEFKPGLNVLFGPNGCGKSTILKALKAHSLITTIGWSKYINHMELGFSFDPHKFASQKVAAVAMMNRFCPGEAEVEWDGTPSLFNSSDASCAIGKNIYESDGILNTAENMLNRMSTHSTGEQRAWHWNKLQDVLSTTVPKTVPLPKEFDTCNSQWKIAWECIKTFLDEKKPTGINTLLLDEPDQYLDMPMQKEFWCDVVFDLAKDYQVIIATHSPFALTLNNSDRHQIVELSSEYIKYCNVCLHEAFGTK